MSQWPCTIDERLINMGHSCDDVLNSPQGRRQRPRKCSHALAAYVQSHLYSPRFKGNQSRPDPYVYWHVLSHWRNHHLFTYIPHYCRVF